MINHHKSKFNYANKCSRTILIEVSFRSREQYMDALSMTILLGVLVMLVVVIAFVLTVKSGQYDDLDGPAYRILMDDDDPRIPGNRNKNNESVELIDKKRNENKGE